jgi:Zn-dependent protease
MIRLLGFEIRIHPSFFVMAAILGLGGSLTSTLVWIVVVTASILVHELGHAIAARRFGRAAKIELYSLGGVTHHGGDRTLSYGQRAIVSIAGPAAGLALGALTLLLASREWVPRGPFTDLVVRQMLWVNIGWGALNLLPILPLDGGQLLQAGLDALTGGRGLRWTQLVSIVVGALAALAAYSVGWTWAALIAGWCAVSTLLAMREQGTVGQTAARAPHPSPAVRPRPARRTLPLHALGVAQWDDRDRSAALSLMKQRAFELPDRKTAVSVATDLFERAEFALSAELGSAIFERFGVADDAYNVACSLARLGDLDQALVWLERAIDMGYRDSAGLDTDSDLESLRAHPEYSSVRARLTEL